MGKTINISGINIDQGLYDLIKNEITPGTGIEPDAVWAGLGSMVAELGPLNKTLLEKRDVLQTRIDEWYLAHQGQPIEQEDYQNFLGEIEYLLPEGDDFSVETSHVDPEIASIAGPQLVVPVDNARYALNAANARWGSLFDALYGTDMISEADGAEKGTGYNPVRGGKVIAQTNAYLDEIVPLASGSYSDVTQFSLKEETKGQQLSITLENGQTVNLADPSQFVGYNYTDGILTQILLCHHGLHIEIQIDPSHPVGQMHKAGVKNVILESAITTIQDCEDSVSAVDAEDKTRVYRNWTGLMKGTLSANFEKSGQTMTRRLNPDKTFTRADGHPLTLPGRSTLLVRNVGIHMHTDAVTTTDGEPIPEGFLDALITTLAAMHDLKGNTERKNSRAGSVYIVKPKMHGPEEVAATVALFSQVEDVLGLERNTIKMGIMDEERRTTVNLKEAIRAAKERVIFINTGFLDRTGDEIHTSVEAGAFLPKGEIKSQPWLSAYEDWNVDVGLETGMQNKAQIGKGMWAMPDAMREMVDTKMGHPLAGATTAWVPSPTAATLHALHYHQVNVSDLQQGLAKRERASLNDILTVPLLNRTLSGEEVQRDLDNNAQGILGYVVRWVNQGVGCSKVPDINNVGLMEDRATLRISSQHIANWLHHNIVSDTQVRETFTRMAKVVDEQNKADANYRPMSPNYDESIAYQAALDLVFRGREVANGYTEPVLHARRKEVKAQKR